jgi:hypothetical protein
MFPATLTGIPLGPGNLRILGVLKIIWNTLWNFVSNFMHACLTGYSTYTLGVKSNIRLKNIRTIKCPHIDVEIVAALPFVEVFDSLQLVSISIF